MGVSTLEKRKKQEKKPLFFLAFLAISKTMPFIVILKENTYIIVQKVLNFELIILSILPHL
jgi:hypothetical protein